ncbi:MAG: hypothetical protein AAF804_22030 [Bacteroidota bacterium]
MQFSTQDVYRLYGSLLFDLKKEDAQPPLEKKDSATEGVTDLPDHSPDPARFQGGKAVDWKMKPTAKLALVLSEEEFVNRSLTGILKQAVLDAGISTQDIGFGVYDAGASSWDFREQPVSLAVVCGACAGALTSRLQMGDKTLIPAPALMEEGSQTKLTALFKQQYSSA